jgi:glycosyltransferase involved in cell wall biosynthesis
LKRDWPLKLAARRGSPLAERAREAGVDVLELSFASRFRPASDLHDARGLARAAAESGSGALIHCHRGKDHWCSQAARSLLGLAAPLVRSRHVVMPVKGHLANRWLFARVSRVICVSDAARAGFAASGRLPAEKAVVIRSGSTDLDRFRPADAAARAAARAKLGLPPAARVAVLVGRMQRVKGQAEFLEAAARVAGRLEDCRFLLVGDGRNRPDLERLAAERGLAERAIFLGRREDVPELLAACDLGVVASRGSEGFSRAALEYMAAGLPVAATRVGALPEIVLDGETGRLLPPEDVDALAGALESILGDAELAARMGRAGRVRAKSDFSRTNWLEAHERIYADCLPARRPPPPR